MMRNAKLLSAWMAVLGLVVPKLLMAQEVVQEVAPEISEEEAVACLACGGGVFVLVVMAFILNIVLLVWVARDAKARGMDGSVLWMLLVMITGLLGLIIYLFSRPKGNLIRCSECNNKRLQASVKCPHCGNS